MSDLSTELKSESHLITYFLAAWDEDLGPTVLDFYPKYNIGNVDLTAIHIFQVYQFFYDTDKSYQRTTFNIPMRKIERKARVLFDIIPNPDVRGGFQPFVVVLLVPEYFTEDQMKWYDQVMLKISQDHKSGDFSALQDYYEDIVEVFGINEAEIKEDINIEEYYSYTAAMEDFQAGIKLFQTRNLEDAQKILKKVLLKFEQEQHKPLILEVMYIMGSIKLQQKRYKAAYELFERLNRLSEELEHEKYLEISTFMKGFCAYKTENYSETLRNLNQIQENKITFIKKLQFLTIFGRTLIKVKEYEKGLQKLMSALIITTNNEKSNVIEKQQAQLLYEIGDANYSIALDLINNSGIEEKEKFSRYLEEAIQQFERSAEKLIKLKDYPILNVIYRNIGNIHEFMGNDEEFFNNYKKALSYARKSNQIEREIKITLRIVQKNLKNSNYRENIKLIRRTLDDAKVNAFVDKYSIVSLIRQLGTSLKRSGELNDALTEFLKAKKLLDEFKVVTLEHEKILIEIINLHEKFGQTGHLEPFKHELERVKQALEETTFKKPQIFRPMGDLLEIWIFSSTAGIQLYSYAPQSQVDHDLLGGFLTALQQFSIEISQKEFDSMVVGDDRYTIYMEEGLDFYMLGRSEEKVPESRIKIIMEILYKRFWKEFHEIILTFGGNISPFKRFDDIIESLDLTLID